MFAKIKEMASRLSALVVWVVDCPDIGFNGMGQSIDSSLGGKGWGQGEGQVWIEDGIGGNQREIADRIFIAGFCIGNHCS